MISIERIGFGPRGRLLLWFNIVLCVILVGFPLLIHSICSNESEVGFFSIMGLGNIIITLFSLYRFSIVEKYPYIVNLPALSILLGSPRLTPRQRGTYINKIFEVMLIVGLLLGSEMLVLEVLLIRNIVYGYDVPVNSVVVGSFLSTIFVLLIVFFLYNRIYRDLRSVAGLNQFNS